MLRISVHTPYCSGLFQIFNYLVVYGHHSGLGDKLIRLHKVTINILDMDSTYIVQNWEFVVTSLVIYCEREER